jgi:protein tyrosine/serine phosphatase
MHKLFHTLALAALCAPWALAAPPQARPGEQVASEDPVVRNFHRVDLGLPGVTLYRSASPVRDLVKGKPEALRDPATQAEAVRILAHLKGLGIATIVSLEDPQEADKGGPSASVALERSAAQAAGLAYLSNPMRNERFKDMKPEEILAWLKGVEANVLAAAKQGGVLLHCAAGHDRTGLAAAYLRITVDHWTVDRAIVEMRALGHNWPKFSSDGGATSWHEAFLKTQF